MPNHEEYQTLVSTLLDHENSEEELAVLIGHLAQCPECKAYLSDQIRIHEAMQKLTAEVPEGFAESVMARVRETAQEPPQPEPTVDPMPESTVVSEMSAAPKRHRIFLYGRRWAGLAACCAVVLLGTWWFGIGSHSMGTDSVLSTGAAQDTAAETTYRIEDAQVDTIPEVAARSESKSREEVPVQDEEERSIVEDGEELPQEYAVLLTTGSADVAAWVERTLKEAWVSGKTYEITWVQYQELTTMLEAQNASFTIEVGTEDSLRYLLCAK